MVPLSTCAWTWLTSDFCCPETQIAMTLSPLSSSASICWFPASLKVIVLTSPDWMSETIFEVSISLYPPLGTRYWSARRTRTTATGIHSHGLRRIRFTRAILSGGPTAHELDGQSGSRIDVRGQGPDVPEVAVALVVVEPVADHEFIGDVPSDV